MVPSLWIICNVVISSAWILEESWRLDAVCQIRELTNRSRCDAIELINTNLASFESYKDFLSFLPIFDNFSTRAPKVSRYQINVRVAVDWQRYTVVVEVPAFIIGEVNVSVFEVDVHSPDFILLSNLDDLFCHWWVLKNKPCEKSILQCSDLRQQARQPWQQ